MADLKTVLKYQDVDLKLRRLTDSIEKSETRRACQKRVRIREEKYGGNRTRRW